MATTYHFQLRKDKKRANGECPVYLRITQDRKSRHLTTGVFIHPKDWNSDKEEVRKSHHSNKSLNTILKKKKDEALRVQADLTIQDTDSAKAIQERLKNQQSGDFFEMANDLLEELKKEKKYHPIKRLKVVISKVERFNNGRPLPIKHMNTDWLERFESYLKSAYGNGANTISKDFEPLRKILHKALKSHLISIDPFVTFEGAKRKRSKSKIKLTINQIGAIKDLDLTPDSWLWNTRNAFLFSFYSAGIRFGDICCLQWSNVRNDRFTYQMNKNGKSFSVALNDYQKEILSHYQGKGDEYIFPFLNSHKTYDSMQLREAIGSKNVIVNKNLKHIADLVNERLDKEKSKTPRIERETLTFHVSRHSYAQYAVESGLSAYELMQTLRHSKLETTQHYLKSLNEELADKAMSKVF